MCVCVGGGGALRALSQFMPIIMRAREFRRSTGGDKVN